MISASSLCLGHVLGRMHAYLRPIVAFDYDALHTLAMNWSSNYGCGGVLEKTIVFASL